MVGVELSDFVHVVIVDQLKEKQTLEEVLRLIRNPAVLQTPQ